MNTEMIATDDFCVYHHVTQTFITDLQDAGLVHLTVVDKKEFIPGEELQRLEKLTRMHRDLEINVPGIASITHLLERIETMQLELTTLRNLLYRFEG